MKPDDASAPTDRSLVRSDVCHGCRMTSDLDLICKLCQGRVSRMALPHQRRSPVLPRPMHDSHSGYTAWGEGRGEGQFGVLRHSHDTRFAEVPSPRPSPPRGAREKGPSPRPSPPRGAREKVPSPRPSPHAERPQVNCGVGRGRARSSTRVRCCAWRPQEARLRPIRQCLPIRLRPSPAFTMSKLQAPTDVRGYQHRGEDWASSIVERAGVVRV
jgi:hypothetical protein